MASGAVKEQGADGQGLNTSREAGTPSPSRRLPAAHTGPRPVPNGRGNVTSRLSLQPLLVVSERGTPNVGTQSKAETLRGNQRHSLPPHLETTEVCAPGPLLPGRARAGWLGEPVLLQPLHEEVINGCKVVVASLLQ